ncbi:ABC transporter ATP-binding protein [Epibacterium ulvae]|uniref:ABC transporter ATP-binding protein n=1 Tax=Epibacterium ulvae TaxID=1156985 RepID=UPI001BFC0248|nr:ABC transporter ATP-binding protein [Epibacterium ulvae]MBT8154422.1 ABC transporter ATP-binding protein [Epibacterium ulvae]
MKNVDKAFVAQGRRREILRGVSLKLNAGETLALTGESGSGKSTLLHLAAALDHCDVGEIYVAGQTVTDMSETKRSALRRDTVAVIFQQFNLVPSLTVWQNIALHARLAERFETDWATHLCQHLGLDELRERYPDQLSGGQQQRVAIARAMAVRPQLLLADEPTGNLDEETSHKVLDLLLDLARQEGTSLLLVTHSQAIAARTDRRLHLSQGRIE